MKYKTHIILILLIVILMASIYPIKYFYSEKEVASLPDHNTYQQAITRMLPKSINKAAQENNCKDYILPVKNVKGNSEFATLNDDINLALLKYEGWKLRADNKTREAMRRRLENTIDQWQSMVDGTDMHRMLDQQKNVALNTKYSAQARLFRLKKTKTNNMKLILTVNNEQLQTEVFKTEVRFVDPDSLEKWKSLLHKEKAELSDLKKKATISKHILYGSGGLLAFYILLIFGSTLYTKYQRKKYEEILLQKIEKRQKLVDNGHFVAAMELLDEYLEYFPDDIEIKAFRDRLLDLTNDDPKKAQKAFVEAQKLKRRLEKVKNSEQKQYLSENEKQDLNGLLPYHPQLQQTYTALIESQKNKEKQARFEKEYENCKKLLKEGEYDQCSEMLDDLVEKYPGNEKLDKLKQQIRQGKEKAHEIFHNAKDELAKGNTAESRKLIKKSLQKYKGLEAAKGLQNNINQIQGSDRFVLRAQNNGQDIHILFQDEVLIGRKDADNDPDIQFDDRRVSREHCRISILDDKVIVEDLDSTGGTYINGEEILSEKINSGDQLTLAKVIDLDIGIYTYHNREKSIGLFGQLNNFLVIPERLGFNIYKGSIIFQDSKYEVIYKNKIPLIITPENVNVFKDGLEVNINNNLYILEVIK